MLMWQQRGDSARVRGGAAGGSEGRALPKGAESNPRKGKRKLTSLRELDLELNHLTSLPA